MLCCFSRLGHSHDKAGENVLPMHAFDLIILDWTENFVDQFWGTLLVLFCIAFVSHRLNGNNKIISMNNQLNYDACQMAFVEET